MFAAYGYNLTETETVSDSLGPGSFEASEPVGWESHAFALLLLVVVGAPGLILIGMDQMFVGTLLVSIPFLVIGLTRPFIGLCYLTALAPLDFFVGLGEGAASLSKVLAVQIAVGWGLSLLRSNRIFWCREFTFLTAFVVWAGLSCSWSILPSVSWRVTLGSLLLVAMTFMFVNLVDSLAHLRVLMAYAAISCSILAAVLILKPAHVETVRATVGAFSPNEIAVSLSFGFVVTVYLLTRARNWFLKLLLVVMTLGLLGAVATTQSRGLLLTIAAMAILGPLITFRKHLLRAFGSLIFTVALLSVFGFIAFRMGLLDRVIEAGTKDSGRLYIWRTALAATEGNRLLGIGYGTFRLTTGHMTSHNLYVQFLVELGIPGVLLWLTFAVLVLARVSRFQATRDRFFGVIMWCQVFVPDLVMSAFTMKTMWMGIAILLTMGKLMKRSPARSQEYVGLPLESV